MLALAALLSAAQATTPTPPQTVLNGSERPYAVHFAAEVGTLLPVSHRIQFSRDGTDFDYVRYGGQDNLFPFTRFSADLDLGDRHSVILLYQPLNLETEVTLETDLVVDEATFLAGTPVDLRYGFDFVRGSYLYDLQSDPRQELALGISLQLRNATINFTSSDGNTRRATRDVGPVPILKGRLRQPMGQGAWWGLEVDGFYAPVSYLNGDDNDVIGSILDSSARVGVLLDNGTDAYLNLRYLGGGSQGVDDDHTGPGDGYTDNWLHFVSLSLGIGLR